MMVATDGGSLDVQRERQCMRRYDKDVLLLNANLGTRSTSYYEWTGYVRCTSTLLFCPEIRASIFILVLVGLEGDMR